MSTAERHDRQAARYERRAAATRKRISLIAGVRLAAFLAMLLFGGAAIFDKLYLVYGSIAGLCAAVFGTAVFLHRRPHERHPRLLALVRVHREAAARLRTQHDVLKHDGAEHLDPAQPHLSELQVFGRGSLFQLLNRTSLPLARLRLATRLTDPPPPDTLPDLHAAAQELSRRSVFRHRLLAEGLLVDFDAERLQRFLAWAEAETDARFAKRCGRAAYLLVALTWACLLLAGVFGIDTPWKPAISLNLLVFFATTSKLSRSYVELLDKDEARPFVALRRMYARVTRAKFRSASLVQLRTGLLSAGLSPAARLTGLEGITDSLAVRFNPLSAFLANGLFLWEAIHTARLEAWRQRHGRHVRQDLDLLSELEVLCSFGGHAADHPTDAWPTVEATNGPDATPVFEATGLGHPLFAAAKRRVNDFTLPNGGHMVLVTGSNMAGKSSFLRTVGVNVVLAQAGAPVCATALTMRPCRLSTSIQVVDAPEQGLSRFYAEVKRIRRILDECAASERDVSLPPRLYLVDEMLSGTNSRERNVASLSVAKQLLSHTRSYGLVTTHDLSLASLGEKLPDQVTTCHFTDRFDGQALHFDYRLHPGVATTTNALDVLRLEGIQIAE